MQKFPYFYAVFDSGAATCTPLSAFHPGLPPSRRRKSNRNFLSFPRNSFLIPCKNIKRKRNFYHSYFFFFFFRIIMLYLIYHFHGNIFTHMEKINVADKYYGYRFKCSFNFSYFISREIQLLSKNISIRMFPFAMPTCCHAL